MQALLHGLDGIQIGIAFALPLVTTLFVSLLYARSESKRSRWEAACRAAAKRAES